MKFKMSCIIILSFLIVSCGDKGTNPENTNKEIYPLAVGNTWTYLVYSINSSDMILGEPFDTLSYTVTDRITINGQNWFFITPDGSKSPAMIATNKADGFWAITYKKSDSIEKYIESARMWYKYPTFINDKFPTSTIGKITLSLNAKRVTPAGTFNCIRYLGQSQTVLKFNGIYLSPGIGMVEYDLITMIDTTKTVPDTIWIRELLYKYKLK